MILVQCGQTGQQTASWEQRCPIGLQTGKAGAALSFNACVAATDGSERRDLDALGSLHGKARVQALLDGREYGHAPLCLHPRLFLATVD